MLCQQAVSKLTLSCQSFTEWHLVLKKIKKELITNKLKLQKISLMILNALFIILNDENQEQSNDVSAVLLSCTAIASQQSSCCFSDLLTSSSECVAVSLSPFLHHNNNSQSVHHHNVVLPPLYHDFSIFSNMSLVQIAS